MDIDLTIKANHFPHLRTKPKPEAQKIHPLAVMTAKSYIAYNRRKDRHDEIKMLMYRSYHQAKDYGYKGSYELWENWVKTINVL